MPQYPQKSTLRIPQLTLHKPTGQARVRLQGRDYYLGTFGTDDTEERYRRLIAEWLSGQLPDPRLAREATEDDVVSVNALIYRYIAWAKSYYVKGGKPSTGYHSMKDAARALRRHYGRTPVSEFGPLKLKAIREALITDGLSRSTINARIDRIKRIFKWAVENELVDAAISQALQAVAGLRKGRSAAKESAPVRPVSPEAVNAVLPHLGSVVRDMVRLQLLTGCRPGEIITLRPCDVSRDGAVWEYVPASHKTEHHGHTRKIYIGPKAQAILTRYLDNRPAEAVCFSPREAEQQRRAEQRRERQTPVQPSQQRRAREAEPTRAGETYTVASYRRAITRACEEAFGMPEELRSIDNLVRSKGFKALPKDVQQAEKARRQQAASQWRKQHACHPNQLRHTRATDDRLAKSSNAVRQLDYASLRCRHAGGPEIERDAIMTPPHELRVADPERDDIADTRDQLERLERRANANDRDASIELRKMLLRHPEVYGHVGDMVAASLDALLRLMAPKDATARESFRLTLSERSELLAAEGHGTALERMLIDHMLLCFAQVMVTRLGLDGHMAPKGLRGDAKFWAARHDQSQKHFQEATTLLMEARKMIVSPILRD